MHFDLFKYTLLLSYTVWANNISLKNRENTPKHFPANLANLTMISNYSLGVTLRLIMIVVLTKATNYLTSKGQ